MRRSVSASRALLIVAVAVAAGVLVGLVGHRLTTGTASGRPTERSTGHSGPQGSTSAATTGVMGPANVVAVDDFSDLGWSRVAIDAEANGEQQFPYACQRRALSATAAQPVGTLSATWNQHGKFAAAETVADMGSPPLARRLFSTIVGWHQHCSRNASGGGRAIPTTLLHRVTTGDGTRNGGIVVARTGRHLSVLELGGPNGRQLVPGIAASTLERLR